MDGSIFDHLPERLVLEGYRSGIVAGPADGVNYASIYFEALAGRDEGARIADALRDFVGALRMCAACPLRSAPSGSRQVLGEEMLVVGLVAALQNGEAEHVEGCVRRLSCPTRCAEVEMAASRFARAVMDGGIRLRPVSGGLIGAMIAAAARPTRH